MKKMDSIAMVDYPIVPLYYDQVIRFIDKRVSGLKINATNLLKLERVKKLK